jgi:BolA protein
MEQFELDSNLETTIRTKLNQALSPISLELTDETYLHLKHASRPQGSRHYRIVVFSEQFKGLAPTACHRLIYQSLQALMPHPIHALAIKTRAPTDNPA